MTTLKTTLFIAFAASLSLQVACKNTQTNSPAVQMVKPVIVTDSVRYDSEDQAISMNTSDPDKSLVIATDKDVDGTLFVYDLAGRIVQDDVVPHLKRPNNVYIAYGIMLD